MTKPSRQAIGLWIDYFTASWLFRAFQKKPKKQDILLTQWLYQSRRWLANKGRVCKPIKSGETCVPHVSITNSNCLKSAGWPEPRPAVVDKHKNHSTFNKSFNASSKAENLSKRVWNYIGYDFGFSENNVLFFLKVNPLR